MSSTDQAGDSDVERMHALHEQDPELFRRCFGPRGLISIGLHASAQRLGSDTDTR